MDTEQHVRGLAIKAKQLKLNDLLLTRQKKGFIHFILDLKDPSHNVEGHGWQIINGLLVVKPGHFSDNKTVSQIHAYLGQADKLGHKPWYQQPQAPAPLDGISYGLPFKTLGKNGANAAVDPVFIIQNKDGSLKVLSIQRFDGSYAFPGGMLEASIQATCINELLEECFSGNLFNPESPTSAVIDKSELEIAALVAEIETILKQQKIGEEEIKQLLQPVTQCKPSEYIQQVLSSIELSNLDQSKITTLQVHLKCELYKKYCPQHYQNFKDFVLDKIQKQEGIVNASDPRNTDWAWMVTTPLVAILTEALLEKVTASCGLKYSAGDDAIGVGFRNIEEFCGEIDKTYSDHSTMLLSAIANAVETKKLTVTPAFNQQLRIIEENLNQKELALSMQQSTRVSALSIFQQKNPIGDPVTQQSSSELK